MRVVIQRTGHASVTINGICKSAIQKGLMILIGIEETDGKEDIDWLCKKIVNLRVFDDENGVISIPLYEQFCKELSLALGKEIGTGEFGADMKVELLNDGPVTICMDTKNKE